MTALQFKKARLKLGLKTQAQVAEAFGVYQSAVSYWEAGRRPVPLWAIKFLECMKRRNYWYERSLGQLEKSPVSISES